MLQWNITLIMCYQVSLFYFLYQRCAVNIGRVPALLALGPAMKKRLSFWKAVLASADDSPAVLPRRHKSGNRRSAHRRSGAPYRGSDITRGQCPRSTWPVSACLYAGYWHPIGPRMSSPLTFRLRSGTIHKLHVNNTTWSEEEFILFHSWYFFNYWSSGRFIKQQYYIPKEIEEGWYIKKKSEVTYRFSICIRN